MKTKQLIIQLERFLTDVRELKTLDKEARLRSGPDIDNRIAELEGKLNRQFGSLEPYILRISTTRFSLEGQQLNPWRSAFAPGPQIVRTLSLDTVIGELNRIIGHYETTREEEIPLEDVNSLFDSLKFHNGIVRVSERLFMDRHYAEAILAAFKEVNVVVQEISGLKDKDGKSLMDQAFSPSNPKIKLTNLSSKTEQDEQQGFMHLFGGATMGIRNPKAHSNIVQDDAYKTLHYLALASLLLKRLDERVQ